MIFEHEDENVLIDTINKAGKEIQEADGMAVVLKMEGQP